LFGTHVEFVAGQLYAIDGGKLHHTFLNEADAERLNSREALLANIAQNGHYKCFYALLTIACLIFHHSELWTFFHLCEIRYE
jgi:hypothetical protein